MSLVLSAVQFELRLHLGGQRLDDMLPFDVLQKVEARQSLHHIFMFDLDK